MTFWQRLDRIWLWMIGISAVIGFPILFVLWIERWGWPVVLLAVLALFLIGFMRGASKAA